MKIQAQDENIKNAYSICKNNSIYTFVCSNKTLEPEKIYTILKQVLPLYMIPRKIIQIENFPLKSSGKIDEGELEKLIIDEDIFDANRVSEIIKKNNNSEYDDYTIDMLSIDSLETLRLLQILSEDINNNQQQFYDKLLKSIVTMKISEIRDFIKKWESS